MSYQSVCNNKITIGIAPNLVHHDHTKHMKVDMPFIKEKLKGLSV